METRFKRKSQILDIGITAVSAVLSVGTMLFGVIHFGLHEAWPELVLNLCYIACLVLMAMYFFRRIDTQRFNYWSSACAGMTVLLRDMPSPASHKRNSTRRLRPTTSGSGRPTRS